MMGPPNPASNVTRAQVVGWLVQLQRFCRSQSNPNFLANLMQIPSAHGLFSGRVPPHRYRSGDTISTAQLPHRLLDLETPLPRLGYAEATPSLRQQPQSFIPLQPHCQLFDWPLSPPLIIPGLPSLKSNQFQFHFHLLWRHFRISSWREFSMV